MLTYRAVLDVDREAAVWLAGLIRQHRRSVGSRWRRLGAFRQALLALVWLRKGETLEQLAVAFGVGVATAYRYCWEAAGLLAAHAPRLDEAIEEAGRWGWAVVDGTLVRTDRVRDRAFYSGKHKAYGVNAQALLAPNGWPLWVSEVLPGGAHDLTAARDHGLLDAIETAGLDVLADKGYQGGAPILRTPYKTHASRPVLTESCRIANSAHAKLRALGERGFAIVKSWRILHRLRCCPYRAGTILRAIHALEHH